MKENEYNFRKERIEKLFQELEYELTRGVMEEDVEDQLYASFYIHKKNKLVKAEFIMQEDRYFICPGERKRLFSIVDN